MRTSGSRIAIPIVACFLHAPISAQVTQRVSVDSSGAQGNGPNYFLSISADGRYVAFSSDASNLVVGDTNGATDVFVRDRQGGATARVSVDSGGAQGNDESGSFGLSVSADGRHVAFASHASNLVAGDTNGTRDVFVYDRQVGTTERVSVDSSGAEANGDSMFPSISADGRYVAFTSFASNLVPGDTNGSPDVFVRDRQTGTTERVSVDSNGAQGNGACEFPSISADGRYVAFESGASNLVPGDTNGLLDVFVRDRQLGTTERVSVDSSGTQSDGQSYQPSISADGRYVAFASIANNLSPGDTNFSYDVFLHDRQTGTTERVSVDSAGMQGDGDSELPSLSADGRHVAYESHATNLVSGDTNGWTDVFVYDRPSAAAARVSVDSAGTQSNLNSYAPSISADGRYVGFLSTATNLVLGDTNGSIDVFVHDRFSEGFTSLCDPGVGSVIGCPCSNPPGGSGRGCDNSAATGGARLSASGIAYLSMDSLVFTASGEKPTATSIVLQGTSSPSAGVVYGQGVRCVGGAMKRLFVKSAVGGSLTAPDFGSGDPSVSARSAAKGDVIQAGQSRFYLVYYRDPVVLGGCSSSSTFNATQTGQVTWWP